MAKREVSRGQQWRNQVVSSENGSAEVRRKLELHFNGAVPHSLHHPDDCRKVAHIVREPSNQAYSKPASRGVLPILPALAEDGTPAVLN